MFGDTTMPTTRHALTILAVRDLDAATNFYRKAFDWPQVVSAPTYSEFTLPGDARLGLYERNAFAQNTGQVPSPIADGELAPVELYFHADDIVDAVRRLHAAGARALSPLAPRDWGEEAAYFADHDGNVLVLARPLPTHA